MERNSDPKSNALHVSVRRIHRRDLNRTWEFLKRVFRDVNRETVEYQRPRTKRRFFETYAQDGVEQLVFEVGKEIVGYAECAFDAFGDDNWVNPRYFDNRGMRPLYIEELAVHPEYQGKGVGSFMLDQLQHLGRVRGCTHLVLEVAENNTVALGWYRRRNFFKLDAAIFMAQKLLAEPELLPPRRLTQRRARKANAGEPDAAAEQPPAADGAKARKGPAAPRAPAVAAAIPPEPRATTKKARASQRKAAPAAPKGASLAAMTGEEAQRPEGDTVAESSASRSRRSVAAGAVSRRARTRTATAARELRRGQEPEATAPQASAGPSSMSSPDVDGSGQSATASEPSTTAKTAPAGAKLRSIRV